MPTGFGGSGGLSSVTTNATLTGAGTAGSPLSVANWPLTFFAPYSNEGQPGSLAGANQVYISGFILPYNLTFSNITVNISTGDAVNLYDLGIYNKAGSLLAHIGAQSLPSTGNRTFAFTGAPFTIAPGLYAFGFTGNANTAAILQDNGTSAFIWIRNNAVTTSAGGVLPASVGALAVAVSGNPFGFALS